MKTAIIGYSGSGKSTLAQYIGERTGAEVLHLDCIHWLPGWVENQRNAETAVVKDFLDSHTSWVIDGNYSGTLFGRRMEEADRILFFNFNRFTCLCRAMKRYFRYRGKTRKSIGVGCEEKMDLEFIWWILHKGRTKKQKRKYQHVLSEYGHKTVVIRNQRQLSAYMEREAHETSAYKKNRENSQSNEFGQSNKIGRQMMLHTERLCLRPFEASDLDAVWEFAGDRDIRYMIFYPHESMAETVQFLESARRELEKEKPSFYEFAVLLGEQVIGSATLWMDVENTADNAAEGAVGNTADNAAESAAENTAEIGWILGRRYRGCGYAAEAAKALMEYAVSELGIDELFACCDVRNWDSIRLMERLGMELDREQDRLYERTGETAREYRYVWRRA